METVLGGVLLIAALAYLIGPIIAGLVIPFFCKPGKAKYQFDKPYSQLTKEEREKAWSGTHSTKKGGQSA